MFAIQDFRVRAIRVSECMLNAAEDLVSHEPCESGGNQRLVCFSPSYSIRMENDEVMLFSSITRYIVWLTKSGYGFLKKYENMPQEQVIQSLNNQQDQQIVKRFFAELNRYGVLSAA